MFFLRLIKNYYLRSSIYNYYLLKNTTKEISFTPIDAWPGNPDLGDKIVQGYYNFTGQKSYSSDKTIWHINEKESDWFSEAHSFSWLRHLKARSGHLARKHSKFLILEWIKRYENWHPKTWEVEILSRRVSAWISNIDFLLAEKEEEFSNIFKKNLFKQIKHLHLNANNRYFVSLSKKLCYEVSAIKKIKVLKGLILSSICFDQEQNKFKKFLKLLELELKDNFNSEGLHASRSPSIQLAILGDLVTIREAINSKQEKVSENLNVTIKKASHSLRFFRTLSGELAIFNGSKEEKKILIDKILHVADGKSRGKGPASLTQSGFEKLMGKQTTVFVDTFKNYKGLLAKAPHAIQINVGGTKLLGSCGTVYKKNKQWRKSLLSAAAHSALVIENTSPYSGLAKKSHRQATSKRFQKNGCEILHLVHYGYENFFSAVCSRTIELENTGKNIAVLDQIFSDKLLNFDIRLHLNPKVKVSLSLDKRKVIIILSDQGWIFNYEGNYNISLEPSIFASDNGVIHETNQIILKGETLQENTQILWGINKDN